MVKPRVATRWLHRWIGEAFQVARCSCDDWRSSPQSPFRGIGGPACDPGRSTTTDSRADQAYLSLCRSRRPRTLPLPHRFAWLDLSAGHAGRRLLGFRSLSGTALLGNGEGGIRTHGPLRVAGFQDRQEALQ